MNSVMQNQYLSTTDSVRTRTQTPAIQFIIGIHCAQLDAQLYPLVSRHVSFNTESSVSQGTSQAFILKILSYLQNLQMP